MRGNRKTTRQVYVGLSINFSSLVVQLILCLAYLNYVIKGDKSGRQAKIKSNEASGNFTRGFASWNK